MPDRRFGIPLATAQEQLQRVPPQSSVAARPLPSGKPGRATPGELGIADIKPVTFVVVGDNGGIRSPYPQHAVATAIAEDADRPAFIWHVGDKVYFGADPDQWGPQFYEPMAHVPAPIIGNPGNHDDVMGGDPPYDKSRGPLDQWMLNLCAGKPGVPPADPHNEFGRDTMTQPYCDWTLTAEAATITCVWSNVPSGGQLEQSQLDWLTGELQDAPTDRPLIVSLHHPPYSIDAHHGGSQKMGAALDGCFDAAKRCPELVLAGHVHDAQFFTRKYQDREIAYVVIGNSGYWHLHNLAPGANPGEFVDSQQEVRFDYGDDQEYGYLKLTVDGMKVAGEYVGVATDAMGNPTVSPGKYKFEVGS